jgi:hypothetical protein
LSEVNVHTALIWFCRRDVSRASTSTRCGPSGSERVSIVKLLSVGVRAWPSSVTATMFERSGGSSLIVP